MMIRNIPLEIVNRYYPLWDESKDVSLRDTKGKYHIVFLFVDPYTLLTIKFENECNFISSWNYQKGISYEYLSSSSMSKNSVFFT